MMPPGGIRQDRFVGQKEFECPTDRSRREACSQARKSPRTVTPDGSTVAAACHSGPVDFEIRPGCETEIMVENNTGCMLRTGQRATGNNHWATGSQSRRLAAN